MIQSYSKEKKHNWISGTLKDRTGPVSFKCLTPEGSEHRRHANQMIRLTPNKTEEEIERECPSRSSRILEQFVDFLVEATSYQDNVVQIRTM
ncbi:Hypothetical protein FKW44_013871 [Caligus rogercresseyi]|uniref:Uncharacterized protein n=1 Tax=Caligus rogercresseyi TaxID=217165 RepID=A0A7T8JYK9_CALRO|nr:Hypothetical protein FKW44_013871 [Caligus rogercresseyi]